ncbi:iron-sulfur cluster biosynthesis family protein [Lacticaseibacillus thailandensis]|nr:iron-sulfur cluster biosynthesis family protein [Lacticaseibacillus thailandensis]
MAQIKLTDSFMDLMRRKGLADKTLLLIADDGGGRYSLQGGACTIGSKFSLIELDAPDPDYNVRLENDAGLDLYTSDYDLFFLEHGAVLDFKHYAIDLKDDAHHIDGAVTMAKGADILAAFKQGLTVAGETC